MKVENQSMFVMVSNNIVCGDGSFKATAEHQIIISNGKDGIVVDIEFMGVDDVTFMGMPINGYKGYKQFIEKMLEMGIDIDEMVDEACAGLIPSDFIEECKERFRKSMFVYLSRD